MSNRLKERGRCNYEPAHADKHNVEEFVRRQSMRTSGHHLSDVKECGPY